MERGALGLSAQIGGWPCSVLDSWDAFGFAVGVRWQHGA